MADNIIGDIQANFDHALRGFYEGASTGISAFVIPIAWVIFGICMLVWCYLIIEGKVGSPINDWLLKFVSFMLVLYVMGHGYLSWIAAPIFSLPSELARALTSAPETSAADLLGRVNDRVVELVSAMFTAGATLIGEFAVGPAIALFLIAVLIVISVYLLMAAALFSVIFSKLGLSMVLAVGPFFVLAFLLPQTRSYFYSWVNTALYFVFYHVFSVLFVYLFIGVLQRYVVGLNSKLGGVGGGVGSIVARLLGASGDGLNVLAACIPILLISMAMFFMFLQIPTICASLTGGSGGSIGAGLSSFSYAKSLLGRSKGG